jgi:hypothetical protein
VILGLCSHSLSVALLHANEKMIMNDTSGRTQKCFSPVQMGQDFNQETGEYETEVLITVLLCLSSLRAYVGILT